LAEQRWQAAEWYVARVLSGGPDWELLAARGHALRANGKTELGDGDWLRAVPGADVRLLWPAADDWAARGKFDYALVALRRLEKAGPSARIDYCQGVASACAGDPRGHRERLSRLLKRLGPKASLDDLDFALAVAVLSDGPNTRWQYLGSRCDGALKKLNEYEADKKYALPGGDSQGSCRLLATRAWLWLRAGNAPAALHAARESVGLGGGGRVWAAVAVGHHREGRLDEAKRCLLRAADGVEQGPWERAEREVLRRAAEKELGERDVR